MSFTVSASAANGADDVLLKVYVVTKGAESGGAVAVNGGYGTPEWTLTPNGTGSVIVAGDVEANAGGVQLTPAANNTTDDHGSTSVSNPYWFGHYTGTVTSGSGVTLGGTNDNAYNAWAS